MRDHSLNSSAFFEVKAAAAQGQAQALALGGVGVGRAYALLCCVTASEFPSRSELQFPIVNTNTSLGL